MHIRIEVQPTSDMRQLPHRGTLFYPGLLKLLQALHLWHCTLRHSSLGLSVLLS